MFLKQFQTVDQQSFKLDESLCQILLNCDINLIFKDTARVSNMTEMSEETMKAKSPLEELVFKIKDF